MTKLAIVFPGQGSQHLGMLQDFAHSSCVVDTFNEASNVLGFDLWKLTQEGPEEQLNKTINTQPAILAASVAIWRFWQQKAQIRPLMLAGHSLGEYTALVCADAISYVDAIKLVTIRGKFMQQAVKQGTGAMAAILGLSDSKVEEACREAQSSEMVAPANYNSPGQVVIAGEKSAVERAVKLAKEMGAKRAIILPVSVPSHCSLMRVAANKFQEELQKIKISTPQIAVMHNVDTENYSNPDDIKEVLVKQLYSPVQWVNTIKRFSQEGIKFIVECGPGKVLTGLNKRIVKDVQCEFVNSCQSMEKVISQV